MKKLSKVLLSDQFQIAAAIVIATALGVIFAHSVLMYIISVLFAVFGIISIDSTEIKEMNNSFALQFQGWIMVAVAVLFSTSIIGAVANLCLMAFLYWKIVRQH